MALTVHNIIHDCYCSANHFHTVTEEQTVICTFLCVFSVYCELPGDISDYLTLTSVVLVSPKVLLKVLASCRVS